MSAYQLSVKSIRFWVGKSQIILGKVCHKQMLRLYTKSKSHWEYGKLGSTIIAPFY